MAEIDCPQKNNDENVKSTFDRNLNNSFNPDLSTDFEYTDTRNSPGASIRYKSEKFNSTFGVNYVFRTLENVDNLRLIDIKRDFEAIELDYYFNYNISRKSNLYFNYGLDNNPPNLTQLQPFNDVSNPLNTIVGNPDLEPTNSHRMYLGYNAYDWKERSGFYTYSGITLTENNIVPRTFVDPTTLKRTTTYDNVNGNYNGYAGGSYSKTIKIDSLQSIRLRGGIYGNFNKNVNFNNDVQYSSKNISYAPNIGFEYSYLKLFEIKPRYTLSLTNNTYDIDAFEDINFTVHRLNIETATFFPKRFEWRNDINYTYNTNIADGFQKSAVFWNSSISYAVLKDQGLVTLKVYDLLNQNTNATRQASQDYLEDRQSTVLTQYFMLNFSWKFNSLGSKGETRGNGQYYID